MRFQYLLRFFSCNISSSLLPSKHLPVVDAVDLFPDYM